MIILAIASLNWTCGPDVEKAEAISCPVAVTQGGHIMVEATISDSVTSRFILDTGGGLHIISNSILKQISSTPRGIFTAIRHTGEPVALETFNIDSIDMGGIRQENPS